MIQLARLAVTAEGKPDATMAELVQTGMLPAAFGQRSDGSQAVLDDDQLHDSVRGGRGTFVPIADMPVTAVTASEADRFARLVDFQQRQWNRMDPMIVAVKRYALNKQGLERIAVDAWMLPFDREKYGKLVSMLGAPSRHRVALAPDDIVSIQGVLQGGRLFPDVDQQQVFFGLKDMPPPTNLARGPILRAMQIMTTAPAYLGAWPKPGALDRLPLGAAAETDANGYSRFPLGLWRRELADGFSVLSFHRSILEEVTPQVRLEEAENEAQIRVHVGDLSSARITDWATELNYDRAYQASVGNSRFLHSLSQQLHVEPADALAMAETLLDVKLLCPLGGQYQLVQRDDGFAKWASTRWPGQQDGTTDAETPYRAPLLEWFRGVEADLTIVDERLILHADLDMQRSEREKAIDLPLFNLFKKKPPIVTEATEITDELDGG